MASPYQWTYDGSCKPRSGVHHAHETFSVGCFQWLPTKDGKRLKRGKVAKRFSGSVHDPESVYRAAQAWCDAKNKEAGDA